MAEFNQPPPKKGRTTPYDKKHFKEDGGYDTQTARTGKSRLDTYPKRAATIKRKCEELANTCKPISVKLEIRPHWCKRQAVIYPGKSEI